MSELTNITELEKAFKGDTDLLLFYVTWIKNGMNAKLAYKELHPDVKDYSAATLGSRWLQKVDRSLLMQAYGLDLELYMKQLREGIEATKWNDFTGEREADHKTRKDYHDKLGKLIGLENDKESIIQQFNIGKEMNLDFVDKDASNTENKDVEV